MTSTPPLSGHPIHDASSRSYRVAIATGAPSGIGLELAKRLIARVIGLLRMHGILRPRGAYGPQTI
jgi:hypothetical protein